ncbi:MAG: trypsin-like peptidase domain-containing protein [Candidatus Woesearchaeota archaeon]
MALKFKNPEHKKFWQAIGVLGILLIVFFIYHLYTINTLTKTIADNQAVLSSQLQSTKNELAENIGSLKQQLEDQGSSFTQEIKTLKEESTKTKATIKQVEEKSQLQLEKLEGKVSQLSVSSADFTSIIEDVIKSVVSVKTNVGQGSGVFIDKSGYVVTNAHVLAGADSNKITVVTESGSTYAARFVDSGAKLDIAVLKVEGNFAPLFFANSDRVSVGQKVIAIGNPGGLGFSVTEGIVSFVNRKDQYGNRYIQTDVPINPGNSGGPLVNINKEIIGITTSKVSGFEGVGFAIASNDAKFVVSDIISSDKAKQQQTS